MFVVGVVVDTVVAVVAVLLLLFVVIVCWCWCRSCCFGWCCR